MRVEFDIKKKVTGRKSKTKGEQANRDALGKLHRKN